MRASHVDDDRSMGVAQSRASSSASDARARDGASGRRTSLESERGRVVEVKERLETNSFFRSKRAVSDASEAPARSSEDAGAASTDVPIVGETYVPDAMVQTAEKTLGGRRARWRVPRRRDGRETCRSSAFETFDDEDERGTRTTWTVVGKFSQRGISVYLRREDEGEHAMDCSFTISTIVDGKRHFETYLEHRFRNRENSWGAENVISCGFTEKEVEIEVCFHRTRVARLRSKPASVCSSIRCLSEDCLLFVLEDFLTDEEGDTLINLARPALQRSRVTDGKLSEGRTSSSMFLTGNRSNNPIVIALQRRIQSVLRLPIVAERRKEALYEKEPMQVVCYGPRERYTAHYDNRAGSLKRTATFMCYLSDPESGGCTLFPKAIPLCGCNKSNQTGVKIFPKRNRAILFWSVNVKGHEAMRSLHEAQAVGDDAAYEKCIFTQWLSTDTDNDDD